MIIAISTSSPMTSVALIEDDGTLIDAETRHAPMQASSAGLALIQVLLDRQGRKAKDATGFAADLGPGSFTGVKVGVTLAKTMAFAFGVPTYGQSSFDLIAPDIAVAIPCRKAEYLVRRRDGSIDRLFELPEDAIGYGNGFKDPTYPEARNFVRAIPGLAPTAPELLVPNYVLEPSISVPKKPLSSI